MYIFVSIHFDVNIEIVVVRNDPPEDYVHTALLANSNFIESELLFKGLFKTDVYSSSTAGDGEEERNC